MDSNNIDYSTLINETISLSENLEGEQRELFHNQKCINITDDLSHKLREFSEKSVDPLLEALIQTPATEGQATNLFYPEAPGVVYRIIRTGDTFCIKGVSEKSINGVFQKLCNSDEILSKKLKVDKDSLETLLYFETKNIEEAEAIRITLINRRFPIEEQVVCNISDPGFSWWMDLANGKIAIYFKSHGIDRAKNFSKLGPIGDNSHAAKMLRESYPVLSKSFPIDEFACSDKFFTISCTSLNHLNFLAFKNIFLKGVNHTRRESFPVGDYGDNLYKFFVEIAVKRKFWLQIEDNLRNN